LHRFSNRSMNDPDCQTKKMRREAAASPAAVASRLPASAWI
jgi:hypothetical protein